MSIQMATSLVLNFRLHATDPSRCSNRAHHHPSSWYAPYSCLSGHGGVFTSCCNFITRIWECTAMTKIFINLPCFSHSSSVFDPGPYDSALITCLDYLRTGDLVYYSSIVQSDLVTDPCKTKGNVMSTSGGSQTAPPTGNSTGNTNSNAYSNWYAILRICHPLSLPYTSRFQASCLCYTSSLFVPSRYDSLWSTCASHYKTASPAFWPATLSEDHITSPCSLAGDVISVTGTNLIARPTGSSSNGNVVILTSLVEETSFGSVPTQTGLTTTLATTTSSAAAASPFVGVGRLLWLAALGLFSCSLLV